LRQTRQKAPFTRESVASRLVLGNRLRARADDDRTLGPVDHDPVGGRGVLEQARDGEHRRQAEGARDDRGVAVGAAELGGEARDVLRIHQCGVGRGQLIGENYGTLPQAE